MRAATGIAANNSNGISGGWMLVIAYEDNTLSQKYISTENGYLNIIPGNQDKSFAYSGFMTPPAPLPVNARYAIAALEGDSSFGGDNLMITNADGIKQNLFTAPANTANNFFDSSISVDGTYSTTRIPASQNTLGFDADIFNIPNPGNTVIRNNQTTAEFSLRTQRDAFSVFFNSFQVEVIAPELTVKESVLDANGLDITGGEVNFADELFYELIIQNQGNEDIISASIRNVLPVNVDFINGTIFTEPGLTALYDEATREINITIDNNVIERFDVPVKLSFGAKVISDCSSLRDACSNIIENKVTFSYTGATSGVSIIDKESILEQDACGFDVVGEPNILIREDICFSETQSALICSGSIALTAGSGFTNYSWENASNPGLILSTNQTLDVIGPGTYIVTKTGAADCLDGIETFVVEDAVGEINNPVIDIVNNLGTNPNVNGNVRSCPITAEPLPEIFLCGAGTTFNIDSQFTTATNISWERLDPAACPVVVRDENCPTFDSACEGDWVQVGTDINFTVFQPGEYRINATFEGDCTVSFYFNVFQNNFDPNLIVIEQIVCDNPGTLIIQNSSDEYEYQLILPDGSTLPYQSSPMFSGLDTQGVYAVNTKKVGGGSEACIFPSNPIILFNEEPTISLLTQDPICVDDSGEVSIDIVEGEPPYLYSLNSIDGVISQNIGPTDAPNAVFTNLLSGEYTIIVESNEQRCLYQESITIAVPDTILVNVSLIKELSCILGSEEAIIEISNITGGTGAYEWSLDVTDVFTPIVSFPTSISIAASGAYTIVVRDANGCIATFDVIVPELVELQLDAAVVNPVSCPGNSDGEIVLNVNSNGSTTIFDYEVIQDATGAIVAIGSSIGNTIVVSNLSAGTYTARVIDSATFCEDIVTVFIEEPLPIAVDLTVTPITNDTDGTVEINATGGALPYTYVLKDAETDTAIATQDNNIFIIGTPGEYIVSVIDIGNCTVDQLVIVESTAQNPLLDYADEIIFCAITGQVYPTITIEDANGEAIDLPFGGVASIVWQKFNDINCDIELENNCPTTDSSCSSGWFDISTTLNCDITDAGEYRVVIEFINKSVDTTQTYYFKVDNRISNQNTPSLSIFPNPARDVVNLNVDVESIKVFTMMGKTVLESSQNSFNIAALSKGVYFVVVTTKAGKEEVIKLMKE